MLPVMKEKMPRLESGGEIVQQDGASSCAGKAIEEKLRRVGKEGVRRWGISLMTQPAQSPDLSTNDLEVLCTLQAQGLAGDFGTLVDFL